MTLQQLEYVLAVARHGHFGRAADACNVTQPTLSAMIGKLEEEIGAKLFDRNRQPICPTPVGEKVVRQAREVLSQADRAGGPYTLSVTDGVETLEYHDVMLGDLWLAGGQSNMEFNLQSSDEYKDMLAEVRAGSFPYHLIRHYFVPHISYVDDNTESARRASVWNLCTPETIPYWSAVAFFFARRLVPELLPHHNASICRSLSIQPRPPCGKGCSMA